MIRLLPLALSAALLPGCVTVYDTVQTADEQKQAENSAKTYSYEGTFKPIPAPRRLWPSRDALIGHFTGDESEAQDVEILIKKSENGGELVLITAMGFADDSVRGEQFRLTVNNTVEQWGVSSAERRVMCWRGADAGKWTTGLCP